MRHRLLIGLSVGVALSMASPVGIGYSDHNGPLLPGLPTPVIKRAMAQGEVTYALDTASAGYPGFRAQAGQVALVGLERLSIPAREVDTQPDIWLVMPSDTEFLNICGKGAAGCILYWNDPIIIYFRRALLYGDWKTTIAHEGINYGHAFGEHEQYNDKDFICTGKQWTVMDCGSGVWQAQPFDVATVFSVIHPKPFNEVGIGRLLGLPYVYWCGHDARVDTAIAPFLLGAEGEEYWLGIYTENLPTTPCPGGKGSGGSFFIPSYLDVPGYCFLVRQGNALSWAKMGSQQAGCL